MTQNKCKCGNYKYVYSVSCKACYEFERQLEKSKIFSLEDAKKLLSPGSRRPVRIYCVDCNKEQIKAFKNVFKYPRCKKCSIQGELHPMWGRRGDLSPIAGVNNGNYNPSKSKTSRILSRKTDKDWYWINEVKRLANFKCVKCGDDKGGNLVSHHMFSWHDYPEQRYDINNGVCLCNVCHKSFHKAFGYGKNTKDQFDQFMCIGTSEGIKVLGSE